MKAADRARLVRAVCGSSAVGGRRTLLLVTPGSLTGPLGTGTIAARDVEGDLMGMAHRRWRRLAGLIGLAVALLMPMTAAATPGNPRPYLWTVNTPMIPAASSTRGYLIEIRALH